MELQAVMHNACPGALHMKTAKQVPVVPKSGAGFIIVAVGAVVAALGIIHVESQGITEQTRQLTGIRTLGMPGSAQARASRQNASTATVLGGRTAEEQALGLQRTSNNEPGK
jgi:hypothetical protein